MRRSFREEPIRMTLYMESSVREKLRADSKAKGLSISQYVETLVREEEIAPGKILPLQNVHGVSSKYPKPKRKKSSG
jgi:hypothetical protein